MNPIVELSGNPAPAARAAILDGLIAFNNAHSGWTWSMEPLAVTLADPQTGAFIGGLWGRTGSSYLFVELMFIPEALRGGGIGTKVMRMAEEEAVRRGCIGVWLDTYSFQARGFYEKLGYTVFGMIDNYPPGHARIFLKKALAP